MNDIVMGGHPQCYSPNINKLAAQGVLFTNAHCNAPLCAPSRASLLTGLMPHTTGYFGGIQYHWRENPNLAEAITFMEYFREHGYEVMGTGKIFHHKHPDSTVWINLDGSYQYGHEFSFGPYPWDGKDSTINGWGIPHPDLPTLHTDVICTSLDNVPAYPPDESKDVPGFNGWRLYWKPFYYKGEDNRDLMPDELNVNWAIEQLQKKHKSPFLLCIGFNRPHAPLIAPKKYFDRFPLESIQVATAIENDTADCAGILVHNTDYGTGNHGYKNYSAINNLGPDGIKKWTQAYLACVAFVDDQIGKILDALEKSEYAENTIIFFSSDNGYHMGEKNWLFKNTLWSKATRIPFVFAGPGIQKGIQVSDPVSLIDFYPTIIDLCGIQGEPNSNTNQLKLDGRSLKPVLAGEGLIMGPEYTISYVSSGKYAETAGIPESYKNHHTSIITSEYRYIRCYNGEEELYDITLDPGEINNLAGNPSYLTVLNEMRTVYENIH